LTDHVATIDPAVPPAPEHGAHESNDHNSPEKIKQEIRVYLYVFFALAILTGVTVWVCYGLRMPIHYAIMVAVTIASLKGFLVAGFFMHLLSERKLIYGILALTVTFFALLMWLPVHDIAGKFGR
jgi:cytochrome c oxidase subunit 4